MLCAESVKPDVAELADQRAIHGGGPEVKTGQSRGGRGTWPDLSW